MTGKFDHRHLHAETNTQVRNVVLPSIANSRDLALYPPISEAARYQNGIHPVQAFQATFLDLF